MKIFLQFQRPMHTQNEVSSVNARIDKLSLDFITSKSESRDLIQKAIEDMTQQNVASQIRSLSKSDLEASKKKKKDNEYCCDESRGRYQNGNARGQNQSDHRPNCYK